MSTTLRCFLLAAPLLVASAALAQGVQFPRTVTAGQAFSVPTSGSGKATLYIVGPAQTLTRDLQLGAAVPFATGELFGAGHYVAILGGQTAEFDVLPASAVGSLGFLARPSRLPVNIRDGVSGAVYVFDTYHNLMTAPAPATLELTGAGGEKQSRSVTTRNGLAWTTMNSATKESAAKFTATVGGVSSTRVISQVPGDPCSLSITARPSGKRLEVQTAPVRDCNGNMIPDGTIVTFTESLGGTQSTVDVPLKKGIATVLMPAQPGAKISAASGVVAGNEIRWAGGGR